MISTNTPIVWNTGRTYSDQGQRIAAALLPSNHVLFVDVDRHITGRTETRMNYAYLNLREFVMYMYDHNHYTSGAYDHTQTREEQDAMLALEIQLTQMARTGSATTAPPGPINLIKNDPDLGELFTTAEFVQANQNGAITEYDGAGYWATQTHHHHDYPVFYTKQPEWATHVMWFNK